MVRGLKLLKPYVRKEVLVEEDDDDDDEDGTGNRKSLPSKGRVMESDLISHAYGIGVLVFALLSFVGHGCKWVDEAAFSLSLCLCVSILSCDWLCKHVCPVIGCIIMSALLLVCDLCLLCD